MDRRPASDVGPTSVSQRGAVAIVESGGRARTLSTISTRGRDRQASVCGTRSTWHRAFVKDGRAILFVHRDWPKLGTHLPTASAAGHRRIWPPRRFGPGGAITPHDNEKMPPPLGRPPRNGSRGLRANESIGAGSGSSQASPIATNLTPRPHVDLIPPARPGRGLAPIQWWLPLTYPLAAEGRPEIRRSTTRGWNESGPILGLQFRIQRDDNKGPKPGFSDLGFRSEIDAIRVGRSTLGREPWRHGEFGERALTDDWSSRGRVAPAHG